MLLDTRFDALAAYAAVFRHRSAADARGRCFHATLMLAREACRLGLGERVAFMRWQVRDDANFLEHWALSLEDGRVLDITSVQVDGEPLPLRAATGYPVNYVRPRRYPVALVLAALPQPDPPGGRYARHDVWSLHCRLFRHDVVSAARAGAPGALVESTAQLGRVGLTFVAGLVLERALIRLGRLLQHTS